MEENTSLAIAFTNPYQADPGDVTDHRKKMPIKEFNAEEIEELIELINNELID
jgi:hypothetical protein